jgi:carotenoid cleavage dioxygenase
MESKAETLIRSSVLKGVQAVANFNRKRMPEPKQPHPFLTGIHKPMKEEVTLSKLAVKGSLPQALNGRYLRIGPNPINPNPAAYHWFTGDGMVHGVRIEAGEALWYRNRWIKSTAVATVRHETPAPGPRHGGFDTVNTNVIGIGGRTFALVEAGSYPVELSEILEDQRFNAFDQTLKGSFTAHPHLDPLTGEHHAICYEATKPGEIRHVVIDAQGKVIRELAIPVKHGPMIHDCALTKRYVVILDLPVTFSMKALVGGHDFPYQWNNEHQARVGLLPRDGGAEDIIWCNVDPAYAFHVANSFELPDGKVVIDLCAFHTMFANSLQGPDAVSRGLERWTVDPVSRTVSVKTIDASPQEFPRPDERQFGQPYRYAFTMALPGKDEAQFVLAHSLYKHDLERGVREVHDFGAHRFPGEFVFVPASEESAEGEGWMIGFVIDMVSQTTELVVIDAQHFEDDPVATVAIPHRIPPGFHGNWFASPK